MAEGFDSYRTLLQAAVLAFLIGLPLVTVLHRPPPASPSLHRSTSGLTPPPNPVPRPPPPLLSPDPPSLSENATSTEVSDPSPSPSNAGSFSQLHRLFATNAN
eukprot:RCo033929